jgi:CMP/dCMP kinase
MILKKIVIAIDGFSSCGKSTFAKAIAEKLDYIYIDSGAMYRAITLFCLRNGLIRNQETDKEKLLLLLSQINIRFILNPHTHKYETWLNGENVEEEIRGFEVSENVSGISQIKEVRHKLVTLQQEIGKSGGIVMDGRDIGTVVFPKAEIKLFMTASVEVRAERRYKELTDKQMSISLEDIKSNIEKRDYLDQNREESPLRKASDAILLDNSFMTPAQQMDWFMDLIKHMN